MNRKWLAGCSVCIATLGLALILQERGRAQSPAPPAPPVIMEGAEFGWIAAEPFEIFTEPIDPAAFPFPDPMGPDVFFYSAGASTDIAWAGPPEFAEFTAALPIPGPDPQQGGAVAGVSFVGPDPRDTITFVSFEAGLGNQAVAAAPYSATVTSEFVQTLPDGNRIERKSTTTVYRDGQGRTRREQSLPAIGQYSASSNAPQAIFINDPVAGVNYVLDPARKIARKTTRPNVQILRGGPEGPGGPGGGTGRGGPGRGPGGNPPQTPQAGSQPEPPRIARGQEGRAPLGSGNMISQSLGTQNIEGILVEGTRVTRTIPAGTVGNQQPIQIVSERWYSPELQLNISVKNTDPMRGTNTTTLSNIRRDEPSASLFQVPSDYTVQEPQNRMMMRGQRVAPPPRPQQ